MPKGRMVYMIAHAKLFSAVFIVLGLALLLHHVVFFGRIADVGDILHHEFFEAVFLSVGFTLLLCSRTQKSK